MTAKSIRLKYAGITLLVALTDRLLKHLVLTWVEPGRTIALTRFLSVTHLRNTGMAFSLLHGNNELLLILNILIGCLLLFLVLTGTGCCHRERTAYALVLGGAVSNIWDRVFFGGVIDYIDVGFWPVFNVADTAISAGAIILAAGLIFAQRKERHRAS